MIREREGSRAITQVVPTGGDDCWVRRAKKQVVSGKARGCRVFNSKTIDEATQRFKGYLRGEVKLEGQTGNCVWTTALRGK